MSVSCSSKSRSNVPDLKPSRDNSRKHVDSSKWIVRSSFASSSPMYFLFSFDLASILILILVPLNLKSGPFSSLNINLELMLFKAHAVLNSSVAVSITSRILILVVACLSGKLTDCFMREHSRTLKLFIRCPPPHDRFYTMNGINHSNDMVWQW